MDAVELSKLPGTALDRATQLLGTAPPDELAIRQAAWVARCVGRGHAAPFTAHDLSALAAGLKTTSYERGAVVFQGGSAPSGVWIVRSGRVELSVGSGRKRAVVHVLGPGDVDGDIQHLLEMPLPYTAHALDDATVLFLDGDSFERLLASRIAIARRWLSSVAMRLAASQDRVLALLGRSLPEQVARVLLDEAVDGSVALPQRTLAAMLGVQRPSLNKILKDFERQGMIGVRYGAIDIVDAERLAATSK
jgi:CRP-like cAMP-binding protein